MRRVPVFYTFENFFNVQFNRRQFNRRQVCFCSLSVALIEEYDENLASHNYTVGKEEYSNSLLHNWEYSSLILYPNSTSGNFLRIICNVESETKSVLKIFFVLCYVKIHQSILYSEQVFYPFLRTSFLDWPFGNISSLS